MNEKIVSDSKYKEIFKGNIDDLNENTNVSDDVYYSFVPLEIEFLERLRKKAETQISDMKQFCLLLNDVDSIARIELNPNDISEALIDPDFSDIYFGKQMNPYKLSAIITMQHRNYPIWSNHIYDQFREIYE